MKESARAFVKVHDPRDTDGGTIFSDNPKIKASTGKDQPIMKKAKPPHNEAALFVWGLYFNKLRNAGISMREIKAYQDLYGVTLSPFQIDLIFTIHNAVEGYYAEKHKKAMEKK